MISYMKRYINKVYNFRAHLYIFLPLLHPIRQIRTHLPQLRRGVLLQVVGDGNVQQGILPCLLPPEVEDAEVWVAG